MRKISFWILFSTTILKYTWKVIKLACVICNYELLSFQDCISSWALHYIYIYIIWHILHVLRIKKYLILWHVKYQMWRCQLRVWTSSVRIKYFVWNLISLGLTPAYDTSDDDILETLFSYCFAFLFVGFILN